MKKFKKLSILLLSFLMAFSCLAVISLAEEDEDAAKIAAIESLLEYYNDEGIYVCDSFDGASSGASLEMDETSAGGYAVVDGKTVWSATQDGENVIFSPDVMFPATSANVAVVYSFRVDALEENEDKGYLALEFSGASTTVANADAQSVLVFDYKEEKAYFAAMNENNILSDVVVEGFVPENGVWYTIEFVYTKRTNTMEGRIVADGASYAFSYRLDGMASLSMVTVRNRNLGNNGVTTSWDLLEVYEGSFIRSNMAGERQAYLDAAVLEYMKEYFAEGTSQAVKDAVIVALDDLFAEGYAPSAGSETEEFYNTRFSVAMVEYYWEQFSSKVNAIDSTLKFDARMAHLVSAKAIDADFPERPAGVTEEYYDATIAAYYDELSALEVIENYSEILLDMVTAPVDEYSYGELLAWILAFEDAKENLLRPDGSYDDTYYGVDIAIDIYENANDRFTALKQLSVQFIAAVDAMNMVHTTDFGAKYDAYMIAKEIVANADFELIKASYAVELTFVDADTFVYDGREYTFASISEDGKQATAYINNLLYTLTISDYILYVEGEDMVVALAPAGNVGGISFEGTWNELYTVADAYDKYEIREIPLIEGVDYCKAIMSDISTALLAKGYDIRISKRDYILETYASQFQWFEEGGKYFGFAGLADSLASFDAFCDQIDLDKQNADVFIEIVSRLNDATSYAEIKAIIDEATPYSVIGNVDGYANEIASIQDINMLFDANKMIVVEAEGNAVVFVENVNQAAEATDLATRLQYLRAAQAIFAKLVDGATGVAEAKELFLAEKESYLSDANAMNASVAQQSENVVKIAFANLKVGVPEKVAFIIKKIYE